MVSKCRTLDRGLQKLFRIYAPILIRYWFLFVSVPLFVTAFLCWGFIFLARNKVTDSNVLYTPTNAPSWNEKRKVEQLWPLQRWKFQAGRNFRVSRFLHVIITAKETYCQNTDWNRKGESCNLLNLEYLEEIERLDQALARNLSVHDETTGKFVFYDSDLCLGWFPKCFSSGEILPLLKNRKSLERAGIKLTYPRANSDGSPIYLATNLGGVRVNASEGGLLEYVTAFRLIYFLRNETTHWNKISEKWEEKASDYARNFNTQMLSIYTMHSRSIDIGMYETTSSVQPFVAVTFVILFALALCCSFKWSVGSGRFKILSIDWVRSKPLLAASGLLTATMGISSGMGLLMLCQYHFIDILTVIPFLIISIGVDDMFIMIAAWHQTDPKDSLNIRITDALSEAATAITITSLTDGLSFAVGCATFIPAVRCFCAFAAVCVTFNYLYQVTFFAGCMVLAGKLEEDDRHAIFVCCKMRKHDKIRDSGITESSTSTLNRLSSSQLKDNFLDKPPPNQVPEIPIIKDIASSQSPTTVSSSFFRKFYCPFLLHPITETVVLVLLAAYLSMAVWGCTQVREGLDYRNLMLRTDPTIDFMNKDSAYFQESWQAEVVFNKPPDLTKAKDRKKVLMIVEHFESSPFIVKDATQFFLREYQKYLNLTGSYIADTREMWIDDLYDFTSKRFAFVKQWSQDIAWEDENTNNRSIKAFRFRVGLAKYIEAEDQRHTIWNLRGIAAMYPEYELTTFGHMWQFADQFAIILPNTLQNIAIALACMVAVSLLFIPNPICTVWITLAIVSIDLGVVGFMTRWDVNLDAVSMITVIMSIGFSVDFVAHAVYGFVSCTEETDVTLKTVQSMERLGWPVFQGALSTVLGMLILGFVDSYVIAVFFKTIFLVIVFGMVHALVFLPVLLSIFMPFFR